MTQLQLEQTQLQTLMQQFALIQRQRQRELKEAAFSIRRRLDQLRDDRDPLRGYVLVTLELRDAHAAGLIPSELEEITDKEYAEASLKALRDTKDATAGKLPAQDLDLLELLSTYASTTGAIDELRGKVGTIAAARMLANEQETKKRLDQLSSVEREGLAISLGSGVLIGFGCLALANRGVEEFGVACVALGLLCFVLGKVYKRSQLNRLASLHIYYSSPAFDPSDGQSMNSQLATMERLLAELKPRRDAAVTRVPELARW